MAKVCIESFADINSRTVVKQGVAFPDNHPMVARYPQQFMDVDHPAGSASVVPVVEDATQAPGQGRKLAGAAKAARERAQQRAAERAKTTGEEPVTVIDSDQTED
jgi:hypothetical protein